MVDRDRLIKTLEDLIRIPSFDDEKNIAEYVKSRLQESNLSAKIDGAGNVIAEHGDGRGLLLNAHLDTVKALNWTINPFEPVTKEGLLYGLGASDDKSGVALMIELAGYFAGKKLKDGLVFVFSVREENSRLEENGSYAALKSIKARRGIVLESSALKENNVRIGVGCKGIYRLEIDVKGNACHSGSPWEGKNPINYAAKLITDLERTNLPKKVVETHGFKKEVNAVANITQINAWEGANVIPSKCRVSLDYRVVPGETEESIRLLLKDLLDRNLECGYDIVGRKFYPADVCTDRELISLCKKAAREANLKPELGVKNGRTDATVFHNYGGIECVTFGPGCIGHGHRKNEHVHLDRFVNTSNAIFRLVKQMVL